MLALFFLGGFACGYFMLFIIIALIPPIYNSLEGKDLKEVQKMIVEKKLREMSTVKQCFRDTPKNTLEHLVELGEISTEDLERYQMIAEQIQNVDKGAEQ